MSGFEIVAGIIAAFFVIGIGVGVTVMIAFSALRYRRAVHGDDWRDGRPPPRWPQGRPDWELPGPGPSGGYGDGETDDDSRRWPPR